MGSNMAEAHPVGFQWVMEAKSRGARVIHIDPRFTRTSAVADTYVPIRAGSDIAFLGGVINYILSNDLDFRERPPGSRAGTSSTLSPTTLRTWPNPYVLREPFSQPGQKRKFFILIQPADRYQHRVWSGTLRQAQISHDHLALERNFDEFGCRFKQTCIPTVGFDGFPVRQFLAGGIARGPATKIIKTPGCQIELSCLGAVVRSGGTCGRHVFVALLHPGRGPIVLVEPLEPCKRLSRVVRIHAGYRILSPIRPRLKSSPGTLQGTRPGNPGRSVARREEPLPTEPATVRCMKLYSRDLLTLWRPFFRAASAMRIRIVGHFLVRLMVLRCPFLVDHRSYFVPAVVSEGIVQS